jgi:Protein of unknown function (DUF4058)
MPSPFPGVDPYLEGQSYWPEFHLKLIHYRQEALNDGVPDHYEARIDERVTLVEASAHEAKQYLSDVAVVERGPSSSRTVADVLTRSWRRKSRWEGQRHRNLAQPRLMESGLPPDVLEPAERVSGSASRPRHRTNQDPYIPARLSSRLSGAGAYSRGSML